MTDEHPSEVLGSLPHRRPHRRSEKRGAPPSSRAKTGSQPQRLRQPAQPAGTPPAPPRSSPPPASGSTPETGAGILGTAVQAAAELAEIGLSAGARVLRDAVARLPRP